MDKPLDRDFDYLLREHRDAARIRFPLFIMNVGVKRFHAALAALDQKDDEIARLQAELKRLS